MDLHAGVTALEAVHSQSNAGTINCPTLHRQGQGGAAAAGTGNGKDAFFLRVDIDEGTTLQHGKVNIRCTQHANFFIHSDNHFQWRMWDTAISQQSKRIGNCNTIVTTQSGSLGIHKFSVMGNIQSLSLHIDGAICIFFANHVHMSLKNHRGMILHATSSGPKQNHVVAVILNIAQIMFLGKSNQVITDHFRISGAVGNPTDFFKICKYIGRL